MPNLNFHLVSDVTDIKLEPHEVKGIVYVPPADLKCLENAWNKVGPTWLHSFSAGVDSIMPLVTKIETELGIYLQHLLFRRVLANAFG